MVNPKTITTMKNLHFRLLRCCATATIALFASCEKPVIDEAPKQGREANANVTLTFVPFSQQDFTRTAAVPDATTVPSGSPLGITRAAAALTDQCSRLSVAIFKPDGTKAKSVNQSVSDEGFGQVSVSLSSGTYTVVAIAHSSTEGNATITSPEKTTFANNKMTDTFSYCGTLTVGENPVNETLQMQRVVAMLRLTVTGTIPSDVERFKFYYTGGSSTLNPTTGYGCVNSKQTEYRAVVPEPATVPDGSPSGRVFDLYTAPHELNDVLKLTITALASDGSTLNEWTMENVPVTRNKITTWSGSLFSDDGTGGGTITSGNLSLSLDPEWNGQQSYTW